MNQLNTLLRSLTWCVLTPFAGWPPLVPLIVVSAVLGVVMAVVFRFTSPQQRLRRVADLSRAEVLAIKLFKDEPRVMFAALGRLLRYSALRLWYSVPPVAVMLIPFTLVLTHLALWYEHRPLIVGESAVLEMQLAKSAWIVHRDASLTAPLAIAVETEPLHDEHAHAINWRIRAIEPTASEFSWQLGEERVDKQIVIAAVNSFSPVSVSRPGSSWWDRMLYPGEPALENSSSVRGIDINYPQRSTPIFGWDVPWWATLLVVSILSALAVRHLVKVQF
jgi:hypothetical protein